MTDTEFWKLIEKTKLQSKGDFELQCEKLSRLLQKENEDEIVAFHDILSKKISDATTYEMLLACFIINSYISDDTFEYFRAWLVGQGKEDYEKAVADSNHFCNLLEKGDETNQLGEYLTTAPADAFEEKTDTDNFYDRIQYFDEPEIKRLTKIDKEEYRRTLPGVFDKFWNQEKVDRIYKKD